MSEVAAEIQFTPQRMELCQKVIAQYETKRSAVLPLLYLAQEQFGHLTPRVIIYVANLLGLPPGHVADVVSFYTMFHTRDMGKYCLQVCENVTCSLMGAKKVMTAAEEHLGLKVGSTSEDKIFSLEKVECLGACDRAPVMLVNDGFVNHLDEKKICGVIDSLRGDDLSVVEEPA